MYKAVHRVICLYFSLISMPIKRHWNTSFSIKVPKKTGPKNTEAHPMLKHLDIQDHPHLQRRVLQALHRLRGVRLPLRILREELIEALRQRLLPDLQEAQQNVRQKQQRPLQRQQRPQRQRLRSSRKSRSNRNCFVPRASAGDFYFTGN